MTTPSPATLNLTISRASGFLQDLQLRCDGGSRAVVLQGMAFWAQLWAVDRSVKYVDLAIPVLQQDDGQLSLLMSAAVSQGILTDTEDISGGTAPVTGDPPELSGGEAATVFATEALSGARAWMGVLPDLTVWDLLCRRTDGTLHTLLRGSATLVD